MYYNTNNTVRQANFIIILFLGDYMFDNIKSNFGNNLKHLRLTNKYTQKDIADFLNITLRGYQYYEVGDRFPSIETVIALSKLYKIPFTNVLYGNVPLTEEAITLDLNQDEEVKNFILDKANSLGITKSDLISYIIMEFAFNYRANS